MSFPEFIRFSHRFRTINTPLGPQRWRDILHALAIEGTERIIDVGCGTGEFSLRLAEAHAVTIIGLDPDELALAEAQHRHSQRDLVGSVEFLATTAETYFSTARQADLIMCVAVQHAFGSFEKMLDTVGGALELGGRALIGDGFWHGDLDPEYAEFLGGVTDHARFEDRIGTAIEKGWTPLYASEVPVDEWDNFEWEFFRTAEAYARMNPDDTRAAELLEKRTEWRDAYLRWGRGVMGFGYFVLRSPGEDSSVEPSERVRLE